MASASDLAVGSCLNHRFRVERRVGAGGMGVVYRATDLLSDASVALKLLSSVSTNAQAVERFLREVRSLAELRHPAIVGYVGHGVSPEGSHYLAMQWLDGEDLGEALARGALSVDGGIRVVQRIAEALGVAHRHGLVHRDIKPSNIFLRDGDVAQATLIDFGLARQFHGQHTALTRTGVLLGTPQYMAPEQARGQTDVGAPVDVFALGCVLFECLTGRPPFVGEHVAAILTRLLFEEPPRLRDLRPELPAELDALVARMLAHEPGERPADGGAVAAELAALPAMDGRTMGSARRTMIARVDPSGEQHLYNLVLAGSDLGSGVRSVPATRIHSGSVMGDEPTIQAGDGDDEDEDEDEALLRELRRFGADAQALPDGSIAARLPPVVGYNPKDRAALAVRCALWLKERCPELVVVVITGRSALQAGLAEGDGIDRASGLIVADAPRDLVRVDRLTAELCGPLFELRELGQEAAVVLAERSSLDESRPLLGRPTPCVGREQELGALDAALAACVDEQSARAVLVRAPAGMGKSRVREEFVRRATSRFGCRVMVGRGDLMHAGAPYSLLASALLHRWGVAAGAEPAVRQARLREALVRDLGEGDAAKYGEFLAELCGVPVESPGAPLQAARRDPKLMLEQLSEAFIEVVRAACVVEPLVVIFDDMQWGDEPSLKLLDAALRAHVEQSLMVVGFTRPEIDERFFDVWQEHGVQEIRLSGLSRRACERLITHALGRDVPSAVVARLVEQSSGNPLFLEELIRAIAAGKTGGTPETVLALLQSRLLRYDPELRRLLRAAACFGDVFWRGGVVAQLGTELVDDALKILVEQEILVLQRTSSLAGEREYMFRHASMREAAYNLSALDDRARDHAAAAEFLEGVGGHDPRVLAEHWDRAGDRTRASRYILAAARSSYQACDTAAALALVERGLACEPERDVLAGLHAIATWVHVWRFEWPKVIARAELAVEFAAPGSFFWCSAMTPLICGMFFSDQLGRFTALSEVFCATEPDDEAPASYAFGLWTCVSLCCMLGAGAVAQQALRRIHEIGRVWADDPGVQGWTALLLCDYWRNIEVDPVENLGRAREGLARFTAADDRLNLCFAQVALGQAEWETGYFAEGVATLRAAVAHAEAIQNPYFRARALLHVAAALVTCEAPSAREEAAGIARALLSFAGLSAGFVAWAHLILAEAALAGGDLAAAAEHLRAPLAVSSTNAVRIRQAAAVRLRLLAASGALDEARVALAEERVRCRALALGNGDVAVRLAHVEVMRACGDADAAVAELRALRADLAARAAKIADPAWRERYCADVPMHARVEALARAWCLDSSA